MFCLRAPVTHYPHARQEVRQRRYGARSMGAEPGKLHSLQVPSHWDPMPQDEIYRLVDILAQTEDEYWGDLEGWQVCCMPFGLVYTRIVLLSSKLPSTCQRAREGCCRVTCWCCGAQLQQMTLQSRTTTQACDTWAC